MELRSVASSGLRHWRRHDGAGDIAVIVVDGTVRFFERGGGWTATQSFADGSSVVAMTPDGNTAVSDKSYFKRSAGTWTATALLLPAGLPVNSDNGVAIDAAGATVVASGAVLQSLAGFRWPPRRCHSKVLRPWTPAEPLCS